MEYSDKLGVYRVGDLKFYSKLEAINAMQVTGTHLHWDFNESVFSSYNWTVEPSESILDLYKKRAQQLRDKYDYIVLMYSGGADSETVLQSFIDNNIKLDEIASVTNYSVTGERLDFLNGELFEVSLPRGKELTEKYPWMKHTIIDVSKIMLDHYKDPKVKFDWIYNSNAFFTPNHPATDNLPRKVSEWSKIIDSGKSFCLLWGHDKPRLHHENNRFSIRFLDFIDSGPKVNSMAGLTDYTDELFFWTPDCPEIVIKQGHLIKNYLNKPIDNLPFVSTEKSDLAYRVINGRRFWLSNHGVHRIIYPNWNINTFSVGKAASIIYSPRDTWFYDATHDDLSIKHWKIGVEQMWNTIPDYWKNNTQNVGSGIKGCWSKDYYLE